ncbi:MAG: hypothetical protein ACRECT_03415 [Thermoplasmata archaeon]
MKAQIAHGPEKEWERVGLSVTVSVTLPASQVRWARSHGYVLSRVLRDSLDRLQGGASLVRTREELHQARERVAQLETDEARLLEEAKVEENARIEEWARENAILSLAKEFAAAEIAQGRVTLHRVSLGVASANLAWIEPRVEKNPLLRSMKPRQVLDLVLDASGKEGTV